jgi:hypothetical protein
MEELRPDFEKLTVPHQFVEGRPKAEKENQDTESGDTEDSSDEEVDS